jgi:hypothetical protein
MGVVDETHVMIRKDYEEEVIDLLQTEVSRYEPDDSYI